MRIRTGYSFRTAAGLIEDVMGALIEKDLGPIMPITDRASTFGFNKWSKLAKKKGVRPAFGVELAVTSSINAKQRDIDYWTFLAIDSIKDINDLVSLATSQFHYEPALTYEQAQNAPGVIKIAGNRCQLDKIDPDGPTVWLGISPGAAPGYVRMARASGRPLILQNNNFYPRETDQQFYELIMGREATQQTYPRHIMSGPELVAYFGGEAWAQEAWTRGRTWLEECRASLVPAELLHPPRPMTLRQLCEKSKHWKRLKTDQRYRDRLTHELDLIASKDFEDYFFIIADLVQWSRKHMIVGPARGSSCGSLVCYLLDITTVDPIQYDLLFERFIDVNRNDLPDIDIDFSDQHRAMAFDYMEKKYGKEHIARLGTVALFKPRSALQEAGTAFRIPRWKIESFADTIIKRSGGDSRALQTMEDTFRDTPLGRELIGQWPEIKTALRMEGHPRHYSQHAAGIILTEKPVNHYVAVDMRKNSTHCDKKDAEDLNLLKIDALGLTQLSVFEDALELAGLPRDHLFSIPMDDQEAFAVLNNRHFSGVFQFNGKALQSICNQVRVNEFEDIVSITALGRPGPLASGGTGVWVNRKNGKMPVAYPHPLFEPYLNKTYGVVCYQEQVMEIGRNIGDLSWDDVTQLRKAMSKSLGKEFFDKYGDRWKAGAIKKGIDQKVLTKVWDDLCAYGAWAFNRSHAVAYGIISYWCCWMKAHYPVEFAAATLTHEKDPDKAVIMLREMAAEGIRYKAVDKNLSTNKWTVGEKGRKKILIGPLQNVIGIGPKLMNEILESRRLGTALPTRAEKLLEKAETNLDTIFPVRDGIKRLLPDPAKRGITSVPLTIEQLINVPKNGEYLTIAVADKIAPRDENEEVNVARRGGQRIEDGMTSSLNLYLKDDTGTIFAKINRFNYEKLGRDIVNRGKAGRAVYAFKGFVRADSDFKMMMVNKVKYIGDI